jgi:hypothetical protein
MNYVDTGCNTTLPLFANSPHALMTSFGTVLLSTTATTTTTSTVSSIFGNPKSTQITLANSTQFTVNTTGNYKFSMATNISSGAATGIFAVVVYDVTAGAGVYTASPTNNANMTNIPWYICSIVSLTAGHNYEVRTQQVSAGIAVRFNGGYIAVGYPA